MVPFHTWRIFRATLLRGTCNMHEFSMGKKTSREFTVFSSLLFPPQLELSETVNYIRLATLHCLFYESPLVPLQFLRNHWPRQRKTSGVEQDVIKIYCKFLCDKNYRLHLSWFSWYSLKHLIMFRDILLFTYRKFWIFLPVYVVTIEFSRFYPLVYMNFRILWYHKIQRFIIRRNNNIQSSISSIFTSNRSPKQLQPPLQQQFMKQRKTRNYFFNFLTPNTLPLRNLCIKQLLGA